MTKETERVQPAVEKTASGYDREWTNWWQGYWSDAPAPLRTPEPPRSAPGWRESAHEFDFGGDR
jgi:hypothetical protein